MLKHACNLHLEGIVSKRADAPYRSGPQRRLAQDQVRQQPGIHRHRLRAIRQARTADPLAAARLLRQGRPALRRPDRHRLGSGGGARSATKARRRLREKTRRSQKSRRRSAGRGVKWVEPKIVVEVDFRGWTGGKLVRQGSLKGVREDKPARQVVREVESDARSGHGQAGGAAAEDADQNRHGKVRRRRNHPSRKVSRWPASG